MDLLSEEIQYTLLQKPDIKVYEIPPSARATGHLAAEWSNMILHGRLKVMASGSNIGIQVFNQDNQLFAVCPVDPTRIEQSVERTKDSSRYFVLKLVGPQGQHVFVGMGFDERNDAFDFWATLVDFVRQNEVQTTPAAPPPDLSGLRLQEGQTISLGGSSNPAPPQQSPEKKGLIKLRPPPK